MTSKQLAILNALVTYAAENIPGGLGEDEREVAQIVGAAALMGAQLATRDYNYKSVNASLYSNIEQAANVMNEKGWRLVAVVSDTRSGYAHSLIFERPVGVSHPND